MVHISKMKTWHRRQCWTRQRRRSRWPGWPSIYKMGLKFVGSRHTAINIRWREIGERDRKNCGRRVRIMPKYSSASSQPIMASPRPRSTCRKPAITSSSRLGDLLQLSLTWSHSPCPAHGQEVHRRLLLDGTSSEMLSIVVLCQLPDCLQDIRYKASVST